MSKLSMVIRPSFTLGGEGANIITIDTDDTTSEISKTVCKCIQNGYPTIITTTSMKPFNELKIVKIDYLKDVDSIKIFCE